MANNIKSYTFKVDSRVAFTDKKVDTLENIAKNMACNKDGTSPKNPHVTVKGRGKHYTVKVQTTGKGALWLTDRFKVQRNLKALGIKARIV